MPRRYRPARREVAPDVRYGSDVLGSFVNKIMRRGKKNTARTLVYDVFGIIAERTNREPLDVFEQAMRNVGPMIEVKPRRVGGATYQIPVEVAPDRRTSLAMRWLLQAARTRPGKTFAERLAGELMDAANNAGSAISKREEVHKMAEANRAFSHYRV